MYPRLALALLAALALAVPALAQGMSSGSMNSLRTMNDKTIPKCASGDQVVWVNTRLNIYFLKDSTYYGHTTQGNFQCLSAAEKAGVHPSKSASASMAGSSAAPASPSPVPAGVGPSAGAPSAGPNPPQPRQSGTTSPEP